MRNEGHEAVTSAVEADRGTAQTRERRRSTRLILVMRGLRSLAYGLLAVTLGVVLADEGFSPVAIGVLITISLLGDMAGTYVIGLLADTWGRRRTLALLALLMAGTGVVFGLVTSYPVLLLAAFFGTLGTSASATGYLLLKTIGPNGYRDDYERNFQFTLSVEDGAWKIAQNARCLSDGCLPNTTSVVP